MDGQRNDPAALPPGKKPSTHCIGAWVALRAVWTGAENIAPPEFVPRPVLPVACRYTNWVYLGSNIYTYSQLKPLVVVVSTVVDMDEGD